MSYMYDIYYMSMWNGNDPLTWGYPCFVNMFYKDKDEVVFERIAQNSNREPVQSTIPSYFWISMSCQNKIKYTIVYYAGFRVI